MFKKDRKPEKPIVTERMLEPVKEQSVAKRSLTNIKRSGSPGNGAIGFWFGKDVVRPKSMCNRAFRRNQAKKA